MEDPAKCFCRLNIVVNMQDFLIGNHNEEDTKKPSKCNLLKQATWPPNKDNVNGSSVFIFEFFVDHQQV